MKRKREDHLIESSDTSDGELNNQESKAINEARKTPISCDICHKVYKNIRTLKQHLKSHMSKRKCEYCEKTYTRLEDLHIHLRTIHGIKRTWKEKNISFRCKLCHKSFGKKHHLKRHYDTVHKTPTSRHHQSQYSCRHCESVFQNYGQLFHHVNQNHPLTQRGGRRATTPPMLNVNELLQNQAEKQNTNVSDSSTVVDEQQSASNPEGSRGSTDESAFGNAVQNRYIHPHRSERYDVLVFFSNIRDKVRAFLQSRVRRLRGIKWNLCVQVEMQRDDGQETTVAAPYFRSNTYFTLSTQDLSDHDLNEAMQKMYANLEKYMREGSGWYVKKVLKLEIHTVVYKPITGSTYISLPKSLALSKSLLNIANDDNRCFLYCLLASLHPTAIEPERIDHYYQYENEVNMSNIVYPVTLSQIDKVERQNQNMSINVFAFEEDTIVPLKITKQRHRTHHVNLLWLTCGEKSHYCLITDLDRFLYRTKTSKNRMHFCPYCLHGFCKESSLQEHQTYCSRHDAQRVELPVPGKNDILKFKDYEKTLKVPFVIYADFETINRKIHTCAPNPKHSAITPTTKLEVCGFGYKVICEDSRYTKPTVVYRGEDAAIKMIECLLKEQEDIEEILSTIEPMHMTEEHYAFIENATHCCICKKEFTINDKTYSKIVRHHNHLTGEIIGPACNTCNINCRQAKFTPVIFHNLKNFDGHILCECLGQFKDHRLQCIAQNSERYVSFSLGNLRFIDSFQFLPTSLESLVENLALDELQSFPSLLSECESKEEAKLLMRKGVYPYDYMDSFDRFNEQELPSKEQFYSAIKKEHISDEDYIHAQTVFRRLNMTSLGEYHDIYLKTDVLLLSDVFESFRSICLKQYELDPTHYYTSPGLSWSACLKMTDVQLELLTDIDKVLMMEAGIRGGVSQISNRYQKANNVYLPNHDHSQPSIYLQYLDANNLYAWAQVQPLPVGDFLFMHEKDIQTFDVLSVPEKGDTGYILEVSLHYPESLHDNHSCLPLAPVRKSISNEELSPYAQHLLRKLHGLSEDDPLPKRSKVEKLMTTLEDKDHYVLHYRNLQLYLRLGMKIKAIHRILKFRQEAWMKTYIDQNTNMRKIATSTFQKNFYKLMNVSVFGKTMENVRLHKNIELIHNERRLQKVTAKPTYKNTTIFNECLVAVELHRVKVNLSKPIYCGMCILDLSKCLMYDFWYNYIKKKYGHSAVLHMCDTDSVLYSCETDDLYEDMKTSIDYFDTSDYTKEHFLHSDLNKKELGKMKDETNGKPISEFVGLRSKMYSFLCGDKAEKRAKGISKVTVKKELKHECYKNTLFNETSMVCSMSSIRSHKHELFSETIQKTGLSAFCDKRFLLDQVKSLPYGHKHIVKKGNSECDNTTKETIQLTVTIIPAEEIPLTEDHNNWQTQDEQVFNIGDLKITPCVKM